MSITMTRFSIVLSIVLIVSFVAVPYGNADETAEHYLFAALECDPRLPDYVEKATTNHPTLGFVNPIAAEHTAFLKEGNIPHALSHFEKATSAKDCNWERYVGFSWSEGDLKNRLHQLARVALFRARTNYDKGRWEDGNRDVERVRIMARHMTSQARPHEHQCFMVENMAVFTASFAARSYSTFEGPEYEIIASPGISGRVHAGAACRSRFMVGGLALSQLLGLAEP